MSRNHDEPLVTVVMPFKNAEPYFEEAVRSVLDQTWNALELVLVDDGGTDSTTRIADAMARADDRIRIIAHEGRVNRGTGPSRALGIRHASGELVAFLDADDVWEPNHLVDDVRLLLANPAAGMVCGRVWAWRSWNRSGPDELSRLAFSPGAVVPGVRLLAATLRNGDVATATCALLARTELVRDCAPHLELFRGPYEDQAINSWLQLRATAVMSGAASAWYRQHAASLSAHESAHSDQHDLGRTTFLTWLGGRLDEQPSRDDEVDRLLAQAVREVQRGSESAMSTHRVPLAALRSLAPTPVRRAARAVRRMLAGRLAPAEARVYGDRLERLLFRQGSDIRGAVLQIGHSAQLEDSRSASFAVRHWPAESSAGPHIDWATLDSAAYDCVIALPGPGIGRTDMSALRHLRRALRAGGVLLMAADSADLEWTADQLQATFGAEQVSLDVQPDPGPRHLPLLLYRAVIPAT